MQIHYQFIAAAAIALIAGVGSVSADELHVADTAVNTGAPFALLDGIAASQMSVQDMAATRGAGAEDDEPGLPGVTIYVDLNGNGSLQASGATTGREPSKLTYTIAVTN